MAIPTTRPTFITYCLQALGAPVLEINVAAEQIDDRVDQGIEYFHLFHMDAIDRMILMHTLTQDDIDNGWITIEEPVMSIVQVIWDNIGLTSGDMLSGSWQYQNSIYSQYGFKSTCTSTSLSDYAISKQHLSDLDYLLGNYPTIEYSMHSNRLHIYGEFDYSVGDIIAYEAFVKLDADTYPNVWNDYWLKEYGTALIGRQWGANLQKFQQVELPGGITLNGDAIYDQYNERVKELETEMDDRWSLPPDFMVG